LKKTDIRIPELLSPAGNLEKLRFAIKYGADSVYIGGKSFSLRNRADNFTLDEMQQGVSLAHAYGKKVYLTLNIFPHDTNLLEMQGWLSQLPETNMDAVIVSDPGTFSLVRELLPEIPVHISTQANLLNTRTLQFWEKLGARRAVLARELSLSEIKEIRKSTTLELETFVHGAMCMSYSGRCLLSSFLTGRSANLGDCAQPCRWEYTLQEKKRPGENFPIIEDMGQSFILNSKDLNMIRHLPQLIEAGVDSFKIEGRMKSLYYVAAVTRVYREALDRHGEDPMEYRFDDTWWQELTKISHRDYTTGFFVPSDGLDLQKTENSEYIQNYDFVGVVTGIGEENMVTVQARNKISTGDEIEWIGPGMASFSSKIRELKDENGMVLHSVNPGEVFISRPHHPAAVDFLLRRKRVS
jgi:putative protease